jgi:hypothetical protein
LSQFFEGLPLTMRLGYFSSLSLSIAHMIYQGSCPQMIKRFDSPNDLYREMLQIKSLQSQCLPSDSGFCFDINHCRKGFQDSNHANWVARLICGILYSGSIILLIIIAVERSLVVLGFSN